ncbi:MAG: folate family ECF transporter S component [Clostridia bacterium]|nr:folate family ECF transporter S component [Clostridia bacterium]
MQLNNKSVLKNVRALALCAMLTAMSVIIGIACKTFFNFGRGLFRITFENLPIIISGLSFGPLVGGLVGFATDIIGYFLSPQVLPPNPIVTLGAILIGVFSGIMGKLITKRSGRTRIVISTLLSHLVGSVIIKSIGLFQFYGMAVFVRIPLYVVISSVEALLICLLYKNSKIKALIDRR